MPELEIGVSGTRVERQCCPISNLGLRELVGVAQLAQLFQSVTVLNPDRRISWIAVESFPVEPSSALPLPRVSSRVGERYKVWFPAPQTATGQGNQAVQCHFAPSRIADTTLPARFKNSSGCRKAAL